MKNQERKSVFRFYRHRKHLHVFCKFQFASDEANGVGGKYGMRKEGQELEGTKEEREVQAMRRGLSRGHVASPFTCSLRCREADCIVKAPA